MNTLGNILKLTSFGESHGAMVGCVLDGLPAGVLLSEDEIQKQVNRRKAGQSTFDSPRKEEDKVVLVSGLVNGMTTGTPIGMLIPNQQQRSSDYDHLKDVYRPNHADYTYDKKYGHRDRLGGGRSSIRITAPIVAAGDIARQYLATQCDICITAYVVQIGGVGLEQNHDYSTLHLHAIDEVSTRCPDKQAHQRMQSEIEKAKNSGDTLGGIIRCVIQQVPVGLGEPIFGKLQAQLANAMFAINTVKGFEYGDGFRSASQTGSAHNDSFWKDGELVKTKSNFSGGIQGGISNGMDIYFNVAFKPISSIHQKQKTIQTQGQEIEIEISGRHDVCAVPRAIPIIEAYANLVMADVLLQSKHAKI